jgi:hypothetical protein
MKTGRKTYKTYKTYKTMKKVFYLMMIAATLLCGCTKKEAEPEELPGSIYGVITDKATGEPVQSAGVQLSPSGTKTVTGSEGQYEFTELKAGAYSISVTKTGYTDLVDYKITVAAGKTNKGDVQIEKRPAALRVIDANAHDIDTLAFGAEQNVVTRTFSIFNDSPERLKWWIDEECEWITDVSSSISGKSADELIAGRQEPIKITIDRSLLKKGLQFYILNIVSDNGSKDLTVTAGEATGLPELITLSVNGTTSTSAIFNGTVTNAGAPPYTERGFVYSTSAQPVIGNNSEKLTAAVNSQSDFSVTVTGLSSNTKYYVRAYATNTAGTAYGNDITFDTEGVRTTLSTSAATNIGSSSATLHGAITVEGSPAYTEKGFCYSKTGDPTIANNKIIVSGPTYSAEITDLEYQTTYYVRAYAIQNGQPVYGNTVDFTTVWTQTQLSTSGVTGIAASSATFNGVITDAGSPAYTEKGFCYSKTGDPTIANNKIIVSGSTYSAEITDLEYQTTYYVRAYAIQNGQPVYGNTVDFTTVWVQTQLSTSGVTGIAASGATFNGTVTNAGSPSYTERGFVYGTANPPAVSDNKVTVSGYGVTGNYTKNITGLNSGVTYYVRAYAVQNGEAVYGNTVDFTTVDLPAVSTEAVTGLTPVLSFGIILSWNVTFNGNITHAGSPAYTERGFCYDFYMNPTVSNNKKTVSGNGTGIFSTGITGLQNYKVYYVRAYVKTSLGTYIYGDNEMFQTFD